MKTNWYKVSGGGFWGKLLPGDRRFMSSGERIKFLLSIIPFSGLYTDSPSKAIDLKKAKDLVEDPQTGVDVLRFIADDNRIPETIKKFIFNNPNIDEDLLSILIDKYSELLHLPAASSPKATDKIFQIIVSSWLRDQSDRNYKKVKEAVKNPVAPTWFLSFVAQSQKLVSILSNYVRANEIRVEDLSYDVLFSVVVNQNSELAEVHKDFKDLCLSLIKDRAMERAKGSKVSYTDADSDRVNKKMTKMMKIMKMYEDYEMFKDAYEWNNYDYDKNLWGQKLENIKTREEYLSELTSVAVNPSTPEKVLLMMIEKCNRQNKNIFNSIMYFPKLIGMNNGASPAVLKSLIIFDASTTEISGLSATKDNIDLKRLVFTHPNFTREVYDVALKSIFEDHKTQIPHAVAPLLADSKLTTTKDVEYILYKLEEIISKDYITQNSFYIRETTVNVVAMPFLEKFIYDSRLTGLFNNLFKKGMDKNIRWDRSRKYLIKKRLEWVRSKFLGNPKAAMVVRGV